VVGEEKMANTAFDPRQSIGDMDDEQLPIPKHKLHGWLHFAGLYASEHVAATEFVIGATFVALGAGIWDILLGLLIGNTLAVLSYTLITAPIAVDTRLSLYTYLNRIAGDSMSRLYNGANALIFGVISAAMITVSATAVRALFNIPPQVEAYPTSVLFVIVAVGVGIIVVLVAVFGFNALTEFASICAPWLMVMFTVGGMVLLPALSENVTGYTTLTSYSDFVQIAGTTVWTGLNVDGKPGIGLLEVAGFAWAANTITHFGLIDMALLRYAKKKSYGLATSTGMMFGHYVAWISAGLMGAATAAITKTSIMVVDPGEVAFYALGASGFVIVVVAGWTTANSNLYRAGLAAQAVFPGTSRTKVTLLVGLAVVVASAFPFIYKSMLPLLTYAGLILVPVGGIVFAEHQIFPRIGFTRYWARYKDLQHSIPAIATWAISLVFGFGLDAINIIPFYYLFLPTWFVSIAAYIVLAKMYGASESYPDGERAERQFQERVAEFHAQQAAKESHEPVKDNSVLSKALKAVYLVALAVPFVLAWRVLFKSPDIYVYYVNLELFYDATIWCTIIYFVFAYWDLKRSKSLQQRSMRSADPLPATSAH
jgi:purine-cytosine permease-like protein